MLEKDTLEVISKLAPKAQEIVLKRLFEQEGEIQQSELAGGSQKSARNGQQTQPERRRRINYLRDREDKTLKAYANGFGDRRVVRINGQRHLISPSIPDQEGRKKQLKEEIINVRWIEADFKGLVDWWILRPKINDGPKKNGNSRDKGPFKSFLEAEAVAKKLS